MLLTVDTDDDDIGNIQLVSPHVDDIVLGEPVSSDWRPVPPLGIFRVIVKWNNRGNLKISSLSEDQTRSRWKVAETGNNKYWAIG